MIDIKTPRTASVIDRSAVSLCMLGAFGSGTGLSGLRSVRPATLVAPVGLVAHERNARPTKAPEAAAVKARAHAHAFEATGAEFPKQTTQHFIEWAFRGPEPWIDPA
ncbi:hypothetical protein AAH978_03275 [Streptomyces sp. ZYX-F-203]